MSEDDFDAFSTTLDAACSLLSRGAYVPSSANTALFFRALVRYELDDVRRAFDAHVSDPQRGRFVPVPADIVAQLQIRSEDDGRPGAEEAWATALLADDESQTLRWTRETAQAWGIARPVLMGGDEVGARMAFRQAYERLVGESRANGIRIAWEQSIGQDLDARMTAIGYEAPTVLQIAGPEDSGEGVSKARQLLARLRSSLTRDPNELSPDALAKQRTNESREEAARRIEAYKREHE